ncbi:uncharacterized protein CEXT_406151 [Caerostris extrusa]|uniref:Uncharacterized protein n=1 Tax=Caerostris extrusa TaxID=172846 RepID=A0AAV4PDF3_CAEEX|nr:uncharacterized protein CEXT_406151 [Caerostris extrusa]
MYGERRGSQLESFTRTTWIMRRLAINLGVGTTRGSICTGTRRSRQENSVKINSWCEMPTLCRRSSHLDSDTQEESSVTFDRKLSWKLHSETIIDKASSRLPILKRLACCRWGCSRSTLNTTYKTFVLLVITYCCEPLISASKQVRKSLETFHNQALRLITGAVKTSPIDAMLLCTRNWPLEK